MHRNELGDMSLAQMGSVGVTTWFHAGSSTATTATAPTNPTVQPSASSIAPANVNVARGYYRAATISWHLDLFFRRRYLSEYFSDFIFLRIF